MLYPCELLIVDLCPGWPFLDLTDDSLFYEAELSSQFKCRVLSCSMRLAHALIHVFPGFANQVLSIRSSDRLVV